jgi:cell division protein FtsZ
MIELTCDLAELRPRIVVIGVGGAGGNAVASMIRNGTKGVDFVVANTDAQALRASPARRVIQLGSRTTLGLGAGSHAGLGKAAAEESLAEIDAALEGAHMCFIAAGLGGGTGTGAAPVIARAARARGILTLAVVSKPFSFEGSRRARSAEAGLADLQEHVDTLIVIPNQNLFRVANPDTTFKAAFDLADDVLRRGVSGITDLMVMPGLINLDFADIRSIMANRGKAMMGSGEAAGDDRAIRATEQAICNPLLDDALQGAQGLIISISGGEDLRLMEVDEVANHIKGMVDPEADIIWGSAFDPALEGRIRVSVFATGIDLAPPRPEAACTAIVTEAAASAARIATLRPIAGYDSAAAQLDLGLAAVAAASRAAVAEVSEGELLLSIERELILTPPDNAAPFPIVDPFAMEDDGAADGPGRPAGGESLFEKMMMLGRGRSRGPAIGQDWPARAGARHERRIVHRA